MRYSRVVKRPIAGWLAAALLVMFAGVGSPAARLAIPRLETAIVWVDRSGESQTEQPCATRPRLPEIAAPAIAAAPVSLPHSELDRSLFQRPPPSFLFS
jgi:hypothetical protein